jgi:hypothetical protein
MTLASRVRGVALLVAAALLALTGCVQVPTTGPVKKVPGQAEVCQNCINVEVAPPAPGAEPGEVVDGYLRAMFNYQPGYTTAKQFLTGAAAAAWRPEDGVSIYRGGPRADGDNVRLVGRRVGMVGVDRTYTAQDTPLKWDFKLVKENGQWRINNAPKGLLVGESAFRRFYSAYSTYFVGYNGTLVPERIYLPALRNPGNIASALMIALLDGPSDWLSEAAKSEIPMGTLLSVDSVTISDGIAEIPLNDTILNAADPQRALMAAQIVYTLRQVSAVRGVLITVDKQKFRLPGADPTSLVLAMDAVSREIDPVPLVDDQLYAVQDRRVFRVTTPTETPELQVLDGPLGKPRRFPVDSLAVSINGTDLAAVTDGRKALRRSTTTESGFTTLTEGLTDLLRPQFTRYGEVWAVGKQGGRQRFWVSGSGLADNTVVSSVFGDTPVTAFRISPDGARMALVRQTPTGHELGIARIVRADRVAVEGWKTIDVTQSNSPQLAQITDVAWLDANELLVLGTPSRDAEPTAVRITAEAARVVEEGGAPPEWNARELTVLSRPQTVVGIGPGGRTWRRNGGQWVSFLPGVTTLAYAG